MLLRVKRPFWPLFVAFWSRRWQSNLSSWLIWLTSQQQRSWVVDLTRWSNDLSQKFGSNKASFEIKFLLHKSKYGSSTECCALMFFVVLYMYVILVNTFNNPETEIFCGWIDTSKQMRIHWFFFLQDNQPCSNG